MQARELEKMINTVKKYLNSKDGAEIKKFLPDNFDIGYVEGEVEEDFFFKQLKAGRILLPQNKPITEIKSKIQEGIKALIVLEGEKNQIKNWQELRKKFNNQQKYKGLAERLQAFNTVLAGKKANKKARQRNLFVAGKGNQSKGVRKARPFM